ncbi:GntR family transcriptional regulator [Pseudochelatococcus sp. B33]
MTNLDQMPLPSRKPAEVKRGMPLYEQIQEALWERIVSGEIAPGCHISDRQWANNLNVSRTPVREAMRQMARDGVLLTLDNGGYQVRPVDRAGLLDLYVCRSALAAAATRELTLRGDKRLLKKIKDTLNKKKNGLLSRNAQEVFKHSGNFHDLIIEGSQNEFLIRMMDSLKKLILFYRFTLLRNSENKEETMIAYFAHLDMSHERHLNIVTAIEKGDAVTASEIMREHLLTTSRDMDAILASAEKSKAAKTAP